jgi:cell division protein FtsW
MSRQARAVGQQYPLLLVTVAGMLLVGLLMILSASHVSAFERYGSSFVFFNRQLIGAILGVATAIVMSRLDYHHLRKVAGVAMVAVILLLLLVLVPGIGVVRSGSSRWLPFGPVTVQPSEVAKLVLVVYTAHMLERKRTQIANFRELIVPVLPVGGLVGLLVVVQPDLGTAVICSASVLVVMYLAGARARHMAAILIVALLVTTALAFSEGYRRARIFTFLNPWADPSGSGWQPIQGQIALGSGGLFGLGLGASRQKWSYVPNAHTDFIYAIVGEELGLAGTLGVLALFVFFIYLGVRTARKASDRFGFLLAGGITGWLGIQALINMGAVTGLLPITGVPLPLISFGGSSLVFTLAGVGILLSIARRGRA